MPSAKEQALRFLDRRDYSRGELIEKLTEKGTDPSAAAEAVDALVRLGFVDDARYASLLVRRCAAKGYGAARVKQELLRRRVPRELWDAALEELPEPDETVDRLLRSRLRGKAPDRAELKRATDALLRRGYSYEEVRAAVSRLDFSEFEEVSPDYE